jgi:hypothetical protein
MKGESVSCIRVPDSSLSNSLLETGMCPNKMHLKLGQVRGVMSLRLPPAAQASQRDRYLRLTLVNIKQENTQLALSITRESYTEFRVSKIEIAL